MRTVGMAAAVAAVLAVSGPARAAEWERDGLAWRVVLSDAEIRELTGDARAASRWVPDPTARVAVTGAAEVLDLVNDLGGRNGVEVSGAVGVPGVLVWPAAGTTPFVRLVAFQADARQSLNGLTRRWDDVTRRVGGGWADAGRFRLRANPDGTVSLVGGAGGRFRLKRHPDGSVSLGHPECETCLAPAAPGPVVWRPGVWAARWADAAGDAVRWTLRFHPDGTATLAPSSPAAGGR